MRTNVQDNHSNAATAERLCYYCNEGRCALCTGSDRTVINGRIVEVPCAHGCREARRKPSQRATQDQVTRRRA